MSFDNMDGNTIFIHATQKQGAYDQPITMLQSIFSKYNREFHVFQLQNYTYLTASIIMKCTYPPCKGHGPPPHIHRDEELSNSPHIAYIRHL